MLQGQAVPSGFIENSSDPNDLQAWCYLCEEQFQREGDRTQRFRTFNGMTIVCIECYADAKELHAIPQS
jgi:hypothetical protein